MKSRWTTYLLLAAVAAVWGVVAWKIFAAGDDPSSVPEAPHRAVVPKVAEPDTLFADYPDPFLKGVPSGPSEPIVRVVRSLPAPRTQPGRRERLQASHLGTVVAKGRKIYILRLGERQYELQPGESAGEFLLARSDGDSLYLVKAEIEYGVKLCD